LGTDGCADIVALQLLDLDDCSDIPFRGGIGGPKPRRSRSSLSTAVSIYSGYKRTKTRLLDIFLGKLMEQEVNCKLVDKRVGSKVFWRARGKIQVCRRRSPADLDSSDHEVHFNRLHGRLSHS